MWAHELILNFPRFQPKAFKVTSAHPYMQVGLVDRSGSKRSQSHFLASTGWETLTKDTEYIIELRPKGSLSPRMRLQWTPVTSVCSAN